VFQERRREDEMRKAQEISQRRRNREDEVEVDGRSTEMSVNFSVIKCYTLCLKKTCELIFCYVSVKYENFDKNWYAWSGINV